MTFPRDFIWGAAAASYQIEGSTQGIDGCRDSVWDLCCKRSGFVKGGDHGFTACDHYRRYKGDVALMKEIGLKAYRLSIMWPRVMPDGTGAINEAGMAYYEKLIDELLGAGVQPWVTLFHWDYPAALYFRGGWLNEDSPLWFEDYARVIVDRFSDRVSNWFTLNEPACFIGLGHQTGYHAPGLKLTDLEVNRAWHHSLLAHGRAVRVIRQESKIRSPRIGFAPCFRTCIPASTSSADIEAARRSMFEIKDRNMFYATWNLDPCLGHGYPKDGLALWGDAVPPVKDGDLDVIAQDLDFIALNVYQSTLIKADEHGNPQEIPYPRHHPRPALDWPITPDALRWATQFLYERYKKPLMISENGLALNDFASLDGKVHDPNRIDYLRRYLRGLHQSIDAGVPVIGYFHWSIMDNFEWAEGYSPRFGLIHVDYNTQKRIIKDSGHWYSDVIKSNGANI